MAARLREDLGVPVDQLDGAYGEFSVLVGDETVVSGGPMGWLGVLPSTDEVLAKVKARLGRP